ncbi:peptidylprolyl isomerase [Zobellia galactanivorans]|uniref:Periplasmic chaperone PpiD n=1 Tax=Zobellia galactanivorans (strain DSM 12802 / CCUG 47099 / CIP 106680 / NCIMB 13871 / Dsij) TaxID=63186 RepID=G0LAE7_ZOBGA|nr:MULTISPECIES: peptidylprolyl isomerase [Zobellia]MBU3028270.1 peptidylprolyl isomerase [Zobellia galactanivorans]MDO6808553.1 peptidylprolyl isomerase [Zobellia galactanivorans]OWW26311.1 peptidylprolyl isomerase [Zobellia sp. OII3]CAZ95250.1 Peptidyl-prolyl isomerase family protein [Zobellia galactanivorans]
MAILENIRKRTTVLILIIGLALFAFVISGVFTNGDVSGGKVGSSIAEINGEEISIDAFRQKVDVASRRSANPSTMQTVNQVYEQEVRNAILGQQFEELGVDIEQDQILNYIGTIPSYSQSPQFQNESGVFDQNKFRNFIAELKTNNPEQYNLWLQDEQAIIQSAKQQTYFNLIRAGIGATLKEGEFDYKLANDKMDIKYVRIPFTSIADSTIAVSKSEIQSYINEHKKDFRQEPARDIQFVYFQEKPSVEDENAVKEEIAKLIEDAVEYNEQTDKTDTIAGFRTTNDIAAFLDRNSDIKFDTIYKSKRELPAKFADTLMSLKVGDLYGPYRDGDYFKVSRMVGRKPNGSVKASHILITYEGADRANPDITRTKEEAEAEAKRLLAEARKKDAKFVELARDNSDGPSAPNGGDLGYFQEGRMVPEFNDFAFQNSVGTIGMVETSFGFHVIKIDDKQDIVQIATLAREIEPSEETTSKLFTDATKFEMNSIESDKAFGDLAKENKYVVRPVNKVKATDENLPGLGEQRSIVQWAFNEETQIGDIKRFDLVGGYAVVQLTKTYDEGLMSVEDASAIVLPKIRKERKAEQIIAANKGKSIDDLAKDNNVSVSTATALTVKSPTIPGAGSEPAVVGTAFAMKEGTTSGLIEGNTGVYMLTVTKRTEAPKLDNYSTYANAVKSSREARVSTAVYQALKDAAEVEDNRAVFY